MKWGIIRGTNRESFTNRRNLASPNSESSLKYPNFTRQVEKELVEAYCVKCRQKRDVKDPKKIVMKNGKPAIQGTCPVCGTKLFRIGAVDLTK